MPDSLVNLFKTLLVLFIPVILVIGSIRLLVTDGYLAFEYCKTSFPADPYGFDKDKRLAYANANFRYVRENQPLEVLADQKSGEAALYNPRELKHMQDVQDVYQSAWRAWQLALGLSVLAGLVLIWRAETRLALVTALKWGGLLSAGLIVVIGSLAVLTWRLWFVAFHQLFFASGTWVFNTSDTLIRLFPEKFWFDAALTISGLTLGAGLVVTLIGWAWGSREKIQYAKNG
jgi:integral membrane protein (TIGR01906 family)